MNRDKIKIRMIYIYILWILSIVYNLEILESFQIIKGKGKFNILRQSLKIIEIVYFSEM